ncbi:uncharacterized protein PAC_18578 [Phialocephala subalpina]|uniref:DUF218 domain-containing protein n=1 Tax=Phialocephala subalpina TaxID=576137 RepID=A0A1L7XUH1_9HELO|nr:uncharacterized protein PAC_18578 [Phialocephala subalpina]
MSFTPSVEEVEKYLAADFQPIYEHLLREGLDNTGVPQPPKKWQEELQSTLRSRVSSIDPNHPDWKVIASQLCITPSEVSLMLEATPHPLFRTKHKAGYVTSANKANYLVNVLLGRIPTKWYPDIERSAFGIEDEAYNSFLLEAIKELLNSNPNRAIYSLFFFAAKIKCVNDHGRLPRNLELEEAENWPSIVHIRSYHWKDRYVFILVFGDSPVGQEKLSEASIEKAEVALSHNSLGFSTRFITCGTSIRPFGTKVVEAYELKQYLISRGVPAKQILIDAASEHTNSNIWNATLLAFRTGILFEHKLIAFMLKEQFDYVMGEVAGGMEKRSKEEVWAGELGDMYEYLTIDRGEIENSVVIGVKESVEECPNWRLMWKNHVGRGIELSEKVEEEEWDEEAIKEDRKIAGLKALLEKEGPVCEPTEEDLRENEEALTRLSDSEEEDQKPKTKNERQRERQNAKLKAKRVEKKEKKKQWRATAATKEK